MSVETSGLAVLNSGWLDDTFPANTSQTMTVGNTSYQCFPTVEYHYPWFSHYTRYVEVTSPARPIKLTLREVEHLREAAQRDSRVRTILEKFTPLIEVSVSFEDK